MENREIAEKKGITDRNDINVNNTLQDKYSSHEDNELQKLWRDMDSQINLKSKEELNLLLTSKAKQTINKYLISFAASIIICPGLLIWLTITALNRPDDIFYMINNITLGVITIVSFVSALWSSYKLRTNKLNQPLKEWLEVRIKLLSKWLTGTYNRLYIILIPLIYALMVLSIHVYYENAPYLEVLKNEESIMGLLVGAPIGLFVSFFAVTKIRKFELKNLQFLKDLYGRL